MTKFSIDNGLIRTNLVSEVAHSTDFCNLIESEFGYVVEPTSAYSPSQNGAAEIGNDKSVVNVLTLLFGPDLPDKF